MAHVARADKNERPSPTLRGNAYKVEDPSMDTNTLFSGPLILISLSAQGLTDYCTVGYPNFKVWVEAPKRLYIHVGKVKAVHGCRPETFDQLNTRHVRAQVTQAMTNFEDVGPKIGPRGHRVGVGQIMNFGMDASKLATPSGAAKLVLSKTGALVNEWIYLAFGNKLSDIIMHQQLSVHEITLLGSDTDSLRPEIVSEITLNTVAQNWSDVWERYL